MRFGSLALKSNLFLSPLAGYTNLPMRLTLREVGGLDLATTDLVNARSLLEKKPKAFKLIETRPADRPLAVQLFGSVPEEMRDAAAMLENLGISSVDINMGCPVRKVVRVGGGSAMMTELDKTAALVKGMVEIDEVNEHLKAIEKAGWKPPADHPDLVPTAEAARLADLLRTIKDDPKVKAKPEAFTTDLLASSKKVETLEDALAKGAATKEELSAMFKVVATSCVDCHTKFRDGEIPH